MLKLIFSLLLVFYSAHSSIPPNLSVRFVTYNVGDNSGMDDRLDSWALQKLLGPISITNGTRYFASHDIFAITLQENCYLCNTDNVRRKLSYELLQVLQKFGSYEFVGVSMTRESGSCESWACVVGYHGTTVMYVFAKVGLLTFNAEFHTNKCDEKFSFLKNAEKGIAGLRATTKAEQKRTFCFAGLHLSVGSTKSRKECVKKFYQEAKEVHSWKTCDVVFMGGDYNTRSQSVRQRSGTNPIPYDSYDTEFYDRLKAKDEFNGTHPWAGRTFLSYINRASGFHFKESNIAFLPTYSTQHARYCKGKEPCYRGSRYPAWTDRIICSGCKKVEYYNSVLLGLSDHDPVVGIYQV